MKPRHLAIIMDGNGRWAQLRRHHRTYGHVRGAKVAREIISECTKLKIQHLTLYAFSTENWLRPKTEVSVLMRILEKYLRIERATLMKENIRFTYIGDIEQLPISTVNEIEETVRLTKLNTGLHLTFALNYGSRQELTAAVRRVVERVQRGDLEVEDISVDVVSSELETFGTPDPDLIVRTSGEHRLSNFMLWQAAYAELYISPVLWPDFTVANLHSALIEFASRERRFGGVGPRVTVKHV